ncbi:MAG: R3H domain-containing nucleic acid-binding protein [Candidatus Paceibacterota bacterium]|jgi:spoIIIJ-associated protein
MNTEEIKKIIEETLKKLTTTFEEVEIKKEDDGSYIFSIKTNDVDFLVGKDGTSLLSLNHLIKRMVDQSLSKTKSDEQLSFIVDVNGYQQRKIDDLKNKAKMMVERARFFKSSVELEPMSSYERMVVHTFLKTLPDIKTESIGVGSERRVVVKYTEPSSLASL